MKGLSKSTLHSFAFIIHGVFSNFSVIIRAIDTLLAQNNKPELLEITLSSFESLQNVHNAYSDLLRGKMPARPPKPNENPSFPVLASQVPNPKPNRSPFPHASYFFKSNEAPQKEESDLVPSKPQPEALLNSVSTPQMPPVLTNEIDLLDIYDLPVSSIPRREQVLKRESEASLLDLVSIVDFDFTKLDLEEQGPKTEDFSKRFDLSKKESIENSGASAIHLRSSTPANTAPTSLDSDFLDLVPVKEERQHISPEKTQHSSPSWSMLPPPKPMNSSNNTSPQQPLQYSLNASAVLQIKNNSPNLGFQPFIAPVTSAFGDNSHLGPNLQKGQTPTNPKSNGNASVNTVPHCSFQISTVLANQKPEKNGFVSMNDGSEFLKRLSMQVDNKKPDDLLDAFSEIDEMSVLKK